MNRTRALLFLALVLTGGALYFSTSDESDVHLQLTELQPAPTPPFATTEVVDTSPPLAPSAPSPKPGESLQSKIKNYKPGKGAEYRAELKKNPHQTPDVAIVAALELGEIFDGVKNERDAQKAFQFYATCVTKETVVALQTSCLRYAKRLSESYSALRSPWVTLEASASDEAKDILKFDKH
jgi:hypothetical protein